MKRKLFVLTIMLCAIFLAAGTFAWGANGNQGGKPPEDPEDPSFEHIYNANQAKWDRHVLGLMERGELHRLLEEMPDFIDQAVSEVKDGSLTWLIGAMGEPELPGVVHGYGTVIGTGNAIVEWDLEAAEAGAGAAPREARA